MLASIVLQLLSILLATATGPPSGTRNRPPPALEARRGGPVTSGHFPRGRRHAGGQTRRSPPRTAPGGEPIDARKDYGCAGDGKADDTACLQLALDAGGTEGRRVHIPGGTYIVSESLLLKGSNGTWAAEQWNKSFEPFTVSGDGRYVTFIQAAPAGNWSGDNRAVLFFPTCCGALPQSGSGWYISDISVDANKVADYGILAPAVYSSLFQRLYVLQAMVVGVHVGWGWDNMIEDSEFELNNIGLVLNNAVNNVANFY